jgi:GNAT superfamily N-acetyltransferase
MTTNPMTSMRNNAEIRFRVARPDQAAEVLSVLDEAAAWLQERDIDQWPARFEPSWVEDAIRRGETWLVEADGSVEATVTLDWSDPVWADTEGSAGYVYRMAVRRQGAGLGSVIVAWAAEVSLRRGCGALRLDCVTSNGRLRAYYEAAGFEWRGDVTVGGAPGQRLDEGPVTQVSRYEMPLHSAGVMA